MFDAIFQIFFSVQILGIALIALVFLFLGALLAGSVLKTVLMAKSIPARIAAVHVVGDAQSADQRPSREIEDLPVNDKNKPGKGMLIFIGLIVSVFVAFGLYNAMRYFDLKANGVYVTATVVDNHMSRDSDGAVSYKAILEFYDQIGNVHTVSDNVSYGSKPSYKTGTQIGVYYDPQKPERFIIDDFWHNMLISVFFIGFGAIFFGIFAFGMHFSGREARVAKSSLASGKKKGYSGEVYYALYEYRMPSGEIGTFMEDNGEHTILRKIPNTKVRLRMSADGAVVKTEIIILIVGIIFFCGGIFAGNHFFSIVEFNIYLPIVALVGGIYIFRKAGFAIQKIPREDRLKMAEIFSMLRNPETRKKFKVIDNAPSLKGRALANEEIAPRIVYYTRHARNWALVGLVVSSGLLCGGYYSMQSMTAFISNGLRAQGSVSSIESRYSSNSEGSSYTYYAVVSFDAQDGRSYDFQDSVGSSYPLYKRGQNVEVLYLPDDPQEAMIDRGLWNWALAAGLLGGGVLILLLSLRTLMITGKSRALL